MSIKIALPKGRLLTETANLLDEAVWGLSAYHQGMRSYRLKSGKFPNLLAKVFQEKDIPIQVAIGNYDLGICGLDWIEELLVKYPSLGLIKLRDLDYGDYTLYLSASRSGEVLVERDNIRIASEYPNLAESFALNLRLKRFRIFPLWGAAEVYPPETADLALISGKRGEETFNHDLVAVSAILDVSACLIANRDSWQKKDLSEVLDSLDNKLPDIEKRFSSVSAISAWGDRATIRLRQESSISDSSLAATDTKNTVRLALPDGHQQEPTVRLLRAAGIEIDDYPSASGNRRPTISLAGITIKVIRPQDMPLQVANGNFDIAITGRDWLREHLYQFPASPVAELTDLKFGRVRLVAVVSQGVPADD